MQLRVLFLSPVGYFKGGAERSLMDLLRTPGLIPFLVVPEQGAIVDAALEAGVRVEIVPFLKIGNIRRPFFFSHVFGVLRDAIIVARRISLIARLYNCPILYSNGLKTHVIACLVKLFLPVKVVLHIRDVPFTMAEKMVYRFFSFVADRLVIVSRACWPFRKLLSRCRIVYNGIKAPPFNGDFITLEKYEPLRLGFVGRFHPVKGVHLLLEWVAAAVKCGLHVRLYLRGDEESADRNYIMKLKRMINYLGIEHCCFFEGYKNNLYDLYRGLHMVVVPSYVPDPLPRVIMEAGAFGIPVIAYPAGGILDMVIDRETGFLVRNSQEFVDVIKLVLHDGSMYDKLRCNAYERVKKLFNMDRFYAQIVAVINEVIAA